MVSSWVTVKRPSGERFTRNLKRTLSNVDSVTPSSLRSFASSTRAASCQTKVTRSRASCTPCSAWGV